MISKTIDSDIDENEDSTYSNATTDDEFYNELMSVPAQHEDCLSEKCIRRLFRCSFFFVITVCDGCKDEVQGIEHLVSCLNRRYNSSPVVFVGTLKDAIKTSWDSKNYREVRFERKKPIERSDVLVLETTTSYLYK